MNLQNGLKENVYTKNRSKKKAKNIMYRTYQQMYTEHIAKISESILKIKTKRRKSHLEYFTRWLFLQNQRNKTDIMKKYKSSI